MATVNTLYNKMNTVNEDIGRLEIKVNEYLELAKQLRQALNSKDESALIERVGQRLDYLESSTVRRVETRLRETNQDAIYYAACVDNVMRTIMSNTGIILSPDNMTQIICKTLECASYQKWQEIKKEAWGRNEPKGARM